MPLRHAELRPSTNKPGPLFIAIEKNPLITEVSLQADHEPATHKIFGSALYEPSINELIASVGKWCQLCNRN